MRAKNTVGRPPLLDDSKRRQIIALLANGSSRRVAARYVGCSPLTIARAAERDPDFAAAIDRAQQNAEIEALQLLRQAARKDRYWRAAAWLLERRNPDDFAPRLPNLLTYEHLAQMIVTASQPFVERMTHDEYDQFMESLEELAGRKPSATGPKGVPVRPATPANSTPAVAPPFELESDDWNPDVSTPFDENPSSGRGFDACHSWEIVIPNSPAQTQVLSTKSFTTLVITEVVSPILDMRLKTPTPEAPDDAPL